MYWPLRVNQIIVLNFQHAALVSDMQSIPKNTQFLTTVVFDFRIFEIRIFSSKNNPIVKHVLFQLILNNISFSFYCRVNVRNMTSCTPTTSPLWQPPLGPTTHPIYRTKSSPVSLFMSSRVCSRKGEYAINASLIRADVVCLQSTGRYQRDWSRAMRGT